MPDYFTSSGSVQMTLEYRQPVGGGEVEVERRILQDGATLVLRGPKTNRAFRNHLAPVYATAPCRTVLSA